MPKKHITIKLSLSLLPDGRCRSRIEESPNGASRGVGNDFELPTPPPEGYPQFLRNLGSGNRPEGDIVHLGGFLFRNVMTNSVGNTFNSAISLARLQNAYLRIAVNLVSPSLISIPWEYFHDENGFLLEDPNVQIVRVLDELPAQMAPFRPFTRLLVAIANPAGLPRFDPENHIENLKKLVGNKCKVIFPATQTNLLDAIDHDPFDAFYFLGHGELHDPEGGRIFLEDANGKPDPMRATLLSQRLSHTKKPVYFAYFNSCDSAESDGKSTFSGVAQRVLAYSRIPAVLAQQAPVRADDSMKFAETFLRRMKTGENPETAVSIARTDLRGTTWGIPVLYTHLRGSEEFDRNRIACLLNAEPEETCFGLVLPSFGMGVRLDGQGEMTRPMPGEYSLPATPPITIQVKPSSTFVYPGETYAIDDVEAARHVESLLLKISQPDNIGIYPKPEDTGVSHWFLFGSLSSRYVASILKKYSPRFQFRYEKDSWCLDELDDAGVAIEPTYKVSVPYNLGQRDYADRDDYGIIEKITDAENGLVFVVIAGLGSRGTKGCGLYLAQNWDRLFEEYGTKDFGCILKFPAGLGTNVPEKLPSRIDEPKRPPPKTIVDKNDLQKGRWDGEPERSGRRLEAMLIDHDSDHFYFDLSVASVDGSPLIGPVYFYLHDSYPQPTIRIIKIESNRAVASKIQSTGTYTAAAQVKDKDGNWIGLEYDLRLLKGLLKRFGGLGIERAKKTPPT